MPQNVPQDRSQIIPFENASDLQFRLARCFDLVNNWNASLTGHYDIADVLAILTRHVEACNVSLFRFEDGRAKNIATTARAYGDAPPAPGSGTMVAFLLAHEPEALTPGSIWRLSELREIPAFAKTAADREWARRPQIVEHSAIILERTPEAVDVIELTFDRRPNRSSEIPPHLITTAMANAWRNRTPGIISRQIQKNRHSRSTDLVDRSHNFLSPDNPAGLSRSEQRVLHLLADGENAKSIAGNLGLSVSTVRTHLRNIYAKTKTSGQLNLIAEIQHHRARVS